MQSSDLQISHPLTSGDANEGMPHITRNEFIGLRKQVLRTGGGGWKYD